MSRPSRYLIAVVIAFFGVTGGARAGSGAALVMDATDSRLKTFSEIGPDFKIDLGSSGALTFIHYQTCREVTVRGGTLSVSNVDYEGSGIVSEVRQPCPHRIWMPSSSNTAVAAGLTMRGISNIKRFGPESTVIITGSSAAYISHLRIVADNDAVFEAPVSQQRVALPSILKAEITYRLQLLKNGRAVTNYPFEVMSAVPNKVIVIEAD